MKTNASVPIFCDECNALAVAILEGAPLCMACLKEALRQSQEPSPEIQPLHVKEYPWPPDSPKAVQGAKDKR
ncbi:MAG: hypothetical protein M0R76_05725 [Proteobacteria bacterium]|jgi:hypothetical protein|nr:hypothetical protein [Pseudomonadota bacterium]NLN63736.1 hypothetical protein [Myxococcales bacterium]